MNEATDDLVHPVLSSRWSPTTFDEGKDVTAAEVESLLEAARWAPSAENFQPWAFILGRRGEPVHERLVRHLAKSAAAWAPTAGLLVANVSHRFVEDTDWDYSEFCVYDLGQAVAHMSFQAQSLGLHVRQFRASTVPGSRPSSTSATLGSHHHVRHRARPAARSPRGRGHHVQSAVIAVRRPSCAGQRHRSSSVGRGSLTSGHSVMPEHRPRRYRLFRSGCPCC